jgi:hypothetical protein
LGDVRRLVVSLGLVAMGLVAACTTPCEESLGVYPPPEITIVGAEAVEVPHISWTCGDFHSDTIDPPPSVLPDQQGRVALQLQLEEGSSIEVSFGNTPVVVSPAPVTGDNTWSFQVPDPVEPLVVRLCSEDRRCAMYWANLYPGLFG